MPTTQVRTDSNVAFEWTVGETHLSFLATADTPVSVSFQSCSFQYVASADGAESGLDLRQPLLEQPFVELTIAGIDHARSSERFVETMVGRALRYVSHRSSEEAGWERLIVTQIAESFGIQVDTVFRSRRNSVGVQTWNSVRNISEAPVTLFSLSSFVLAVPSDFLAPDNAHVAWARNEWIAENRWTVEALRANELPDLGLAIHGQDPRGSMSRSSTGSWSTGRFLPSAVVFDAESGWSFGWQVESNAQWTWEIGERRRGLYVVAAGPSDAAHQWRHTLEPGESFESVTAGFVVSHEGLDGALAALTDYRRSIRSAHIDHQDLPVIYNDYMNTLDGKPTTTELIPLIEAASAVGAEVFVIDAGWYSDSDDWWDAVGEWAPATTRFLPEGFGYIVDRIQATGMKVGLWMEPESVGIRSPVASLLPAEAFVQRGGVPKVEQSRLQLDLRNPMARDHLDRAVDRLVAEFGVQYFKFDYNVSAGSGTDYMAQSVGDGLLEMGRAQIAWIRSLYARYPNLTLESCASGAMRADYVELAEFQLQSTSDQQNFDRYPPIAAAALASIAPEQAASWAYPQAGMSYEEIVFCLVNGLMGRLYLSGFLNRMTSSDLALVSEAVAVSKSLNAVIRFGRPFWPLGLPGWSDAVVSVGIRGQDYDVIAVWSRHADNRPIQFALELFVNDDVAVTQIFPAGGPQWGSSWDSVSGILTVTPGDEVLAARLFSVTRNGAAMEGNRTPRNEHLQGPSSTTK